MESSRFRYFDEDKYELWVVEKMALAGILSRINDRVLQKQLKKKTIVIPLSTYHEIISMSKTNCTIGYTMFTAELINTLTAILSKTAGCNRQESGYYDYYKTIDSGIKFIFFLDNTSTTQSAIKYCKENIQMLAKDLYRENHTATINYLPEVKVAYHIDRDRSGHYLFDFN